MPSHLPYDALNLEIEGVVVQELRAIDGFVRLYGTALVKKAYMFANLTNNGFHSSFTFGAFFDL